MTKSTDRTVFKRDDGQWANKRNEATRPASLHKTQKEANAAAAENLKNQGGGERTTKGVNGKIVSKDTIMGNDPRSIKDTEH